MDASEMRQSKSGDMLLSRTGIIPFIVTEVVEGHVWGNFKESFVSGECCRICGIMRRRDRMNNPCKGSPGITLRGK